MAASVAAEAETRNERRESVFIAERLSPINPPPRQHLRCGSHLRWGRRRLRAKADNGVTAEQVTVRQE